LDIFKFQYDTDQTVLERGDIIDNIKSIMWVERYRDPGEFQITAPLYSDLKNLLPAGTLISHVDTLEVMIVESHEINQTQDDDPEISITGRSFETYLENRVVGINQARTSNLFDPYELNAAYTWHQAATFINEHISTTENADDALVNVVAIEVVSGTGVSKKRIIDRGNVHERLLEILDVDNLGIKTVRRNTFGVSGSPDETRFVIHKGVDRSDSVIFSWPSGDIESLSYLFSDKKRKNAALVQSKWLNVIVDNASTNYDRRFMEVDATKMDEKFEAVPTGADLIRIMDRMITRGEQSLRRQHYVNISSANVSNVTQYKYRKHYNVGDLVMVDGSFNQMAKMRVSEYAEIEDENGESGSPTLSLPNEPDA
jgi:Siphovirus ReqiPepy6 Gp37-like protein